MKELLNQSISKIHLKLKERERACLELIEFMFEKINKSSLNSYITTFESQAKARAMEIDKKGDFNNLLTGIPIAIKDNICIKGFPTTCGSRILKDFIPPYNATVIDKLDKAGAIFLGKTNLDEFAMGSSTENSAFGPTFNPLNPEYVPGGSSGGSAASVGGGETICALGSDTGGSIRQPASFCGIVGLKPSYGRVSRYGLVAFASSLDQIGVLTRCVEDAAILLETIAGQDDRDSTSRNVSVPFYFKNLEPKVKGLKIGLPEEYFGEGIAPEVKERVLNAVHTLEKLGAKLCEVSLPHTDYAISTYYLIATAETSANLARYDGVRYGYRSRKWEVGSGKWEVGSGKSEVRGQKSGVRGQKSEVRSQKLKDMYEITRDEGFGNEVKRRIMLGTFGLQSGYYDEYYLKARKVRGLIAEDFENAFKEVDILITPTSPTLPFKLGEKTKDPLQMYLSDILTVSASLAGLPAISIPCGDFSGLSIGLQIIGKPFDEQTILNTAYAYERA
ncbi:aspartyl/glutamyl-tRNA amidotransferase subunit A [candidate division WOR-3 bacterium]|nr:aspartyl/glutamyl-tRNA amidotransferase subunit A [candidate division WOR-3 bacterium]